MSPYKKLILAFLGGMALFSCEKDDPIIPNEEELITTLIYTLTPSAGGDAVTFIFRDLDGDGGNPPVITTETLSANTVYTGQLQMLNELETPAEDISEEVAEEAEEHQIFYVIEGLLDATVAYTDFDMNGNPLGLATTMTTREVSTGVLTIILRHEPKKPNNGTPSDAGGETDIEVEFELQIL